MISKVIYIGILLSISGYFVVGGISNILIDEKFEYAKELPSQPVQDLESGVYRNIAEMKAHDEYEKMLSAYPSYEKFGDTLMYLINLMCFGILGSITRIILTLPTKRNTLDSIKVYSLPILGAITGLIVIVVSEILPDFKYASGTQKIYFGLALLGGIYSTEFFKWLKYKAGQILKTD